VLIAKWIGRILCGFKSLHLLTSFIGEFTELNKQISDVPPYGPVLSGFTEV
jgi:hypothetical protein